MHSIHPHTMNSQIQNHESMLRESIKHFLASYHNGSSDFSSFESIFFRLIQTMLDPPLEITWFYSAVTFHTAKWSSQNNVSARVVVAKDLFNLLVSCSNLSCALKKIALLAPLVYELYNIVYDCRVNGVCVDNGVERLVEDIISYVLVSTGVCDSGNEVVEFDKAVVCFEDLVCVWTVDRGGGRISLEENMRLFFPVLVDGMRKGVSARCGVRELVGIVLFEVFFLRLCLCFRSGLCTEDLVEDMRNQALQTIKGFRSCHFLDMLFKMLLEPKMPFADLLNSDDAVILRKTLYDAVMFVDYSLYSGRWVQSSDSHSKKLTLLWVFVADRAIEYARATTDQMRAISYLNAFRESRLVAELVKWGTKQAGMLEQSSTPDVSSPKVLMKWLMDLENQGIRVFDLSISVLHAKAVACVSTEDNVSPQLKLEVENPSVSKDQEMGDPSNIGISGALCPVNTDSDICRKRKEVVSGVQESRAKQMKCDFLGSSVCRKFLPFSSDNGLHCGNVVKHVASDDDMELIG